MCVYNSCQKVTSESLSNVASILGDEASRSLSCDFGDGDGIFCQSYVENLRQMARGSDQKPRSQLANLVHFPISEVKKGEVRRTSTTARIRLWCSGMFDRKTLYLMVE
jgi:hypothetical protein